MDYRAKNCEICGCGDLKELSHEFVDGNVFYTYQCLACGETFSTLTAYQTREKRLAAQEKKKAEESVSKNTDKLSAADVYKLNINKTVAISSEFGDMTAFGSGIHIGNGYILTNAHVVTTTNEEGKTDIADTIVVNSDNVAKHEVDYVFSDVKKDLALLYSDELTEKAVVCKAPVETGNKIYVIGNSKGEGICVLDGLISDNERFKNGERYIMISAPVTTGSSGGPVFNEAGELIGIVTAGKKNVQSMNYAIPVSEIVSFIHQAEDKEGIVIGL